MNARKLAIQDGRVLVVREAAPDDAGALLTYIEEISGQSDFLSFGRGEFDLIEAEERDFLRNCCESENQPYIIGLIDHSIVSTLRTAESSGATYSAQGFIL